MVGIYIIEDTRNKKAYIGQSKDIKKRLRDHLSSLEKRKHHSKKLQEAFDEYGALHFRFRVLELCKHSELAEKEKLWIARYNSIDRGYNVQDPGIIDYKKALKELDKKRHGETFFYWFVISGFSVAASCAVILISHDLLKLLDGNTKKIILVNEPLLLRLFIVVGLWICVENIRNCVKELKEVKKKYPKWRI